MLAVRRGFVPKAGWESRCIQRVPGGTGAGSDFVCSLGFLEEMPLVRVKADGTEEWAVILMATKVCP